MSHDYSEKYDSREKHVVFYRVPLNNTYWTILISIPKIEIYATLTGFRNRLILIFALVLIVMAIYFFAFTKVRAILKEESKRKTAEKSLKNSEERFRKLFDFAPDAYYLSDLLGNFIDGNKAAEKLTGYKKEELIGKNFLQIGILNSESFKLASTALAKSVLGQSTGPDEIELKRKDGNTIQVEIITHPVDLLGKKVILGLARDITERKRAEKEMIETKEKAEEANRLKSGFLSAMSHEIRTPLNIIIGYNGVIRDIFEKDSNKEHKMFFDAIENGSLRLLNTITQILDISRIEANEFNVELISMSINQVIESVYRQLKILADKKRLGFNLVLPESDIKVIADEYCLNGVLMNIMSNAIKYSEKGTIEVKLMKDKEHAVCTIKDEGIGMSGKYYKHLFQPFSQEDVGFKRRYEGTGLGLALTKSYIDNMNGEIRVETKKGVGTTITFKIPLDK